MCDVCADFVVKNKLVCVTVSGVVVNAGFVNVMRSEGISAGTSHEVLS